MVIALLFRSSYSSGMLSPWVIFIPFFLFHHFLSLLCFSSRSRSLRSNPPHFIAEEPGTEGLLTAGPCLGLWLPTFLLLVAYEDPTLISVSKNYTILACQNLFLDLSPKMSFWLQFFLSFFLMFTVGCSSREHHGFCFLQRFKDLIYSCNKFFYLAFCVFQDIL